MGSNRRTCFESESVMALEGHRRSLISAPIDSAYVTSYWLLIVTLGPVLPRFRDIAGFLRRATPPLFHSNFGAVPLGLDCRCCGSEERRPESNYSCVYFRTNSTYMPTTPQRHGQTDGWLTIAIPREHYVQRAVINADIKSTLTLQWNKSTVLCRNAAFLYTHLEISTYLSVCKLNTLK